MLKTTGIVILTQFVLFCSSYSISNAHVHGEGQLFIVEEGSKIQLEFIIPAADIIGFEHLAQTDEQIAHVNQLSESLSVISSLVTLPTNCDEINIQHTLDEFSPPSEQVNVKAKNQLSDKHHGDVNITLLIACTDKISRVEVKIFSIAPALKTIKAQWITSTAQGSKVINSADPIVQI